MAQILRAPGCGLVARVIEADAGFAELQLSAQKAFPTLFEDPGRGREGTEVGLNVVGEDGEEMECRDGSWIGARTLGSVARGGTVRLPPNASGHARSCGFALLLCCADV